MKAYRLLFIIVILVFYFGYGQAQEAKPKSASTVGAVFNFRFDRAVLDSGYMHNAISLKKLDRTLSDTSTISTIDSIRITATSSIDGNIDHNRALALHRAKAIKGYILWKYPRVHAKIVITSVIGENWEGLRRCIEQDDKVPFRTKVLEIIDQDVNPETKEWRLRQVGSGAAWTYVASNFLKYLSVGSAQVDICRQELFATGQERASEPDTLITPTTEKPILTQAGFKAVLLLTSSGHRLPIALKTNLLFDAATALNIELEIPIGRRWSVAGEWIFPWWSKPSSHRYFQLLSGNLEGRYWFGRRDKQPQLTGWFAGLYAGGGYYDLMFNKDKGYQGEFYIATGISGGYAHTMNKSESLRMEYSLGIGYLRTNYKKYSWDGYDYMLDAPSEQSRNTLWFGPTRAKVSLVWMLNLKGREGGAK